MITFCPLGLPRPQKFSHKRRILIVDDNWFFAASLRTMIDSETDLAVCDTAKSGDGLLERVTHFRPELIVLDITLGSEDGLTLARRLRSDGVAAPILLISTLSTPTAHELDKIGHCAFWRKGDASAKFLRRAREFLLLEAAAEQSADGNDQLAFAARTAHPPQ